MDINLPNEVKYIINMLNKSGHEAYIVGGCVRDCVMGKSPSDWDITTSSLPECTMNVFKGHNIIETGLKHGTVTLVIDSVPYEITTYRIDGEYTDNRRPDSVQFVCNLKEDLSRRDFTVNAMAYSTDKGLIDYFGGMNDINDGIITCVGDPDRRFCEDALRIMRALRFASVLGFIIEDSTAEAMLRNKKLLNNIASERIREELNKMLKGDGVREVMLANLPVITEVIPELSPSAGFEQSTPYHCYDVLNHTLHSVENAEKDVIIRLTMVLHDIAKPLCYTEADGIGHFYGHAKMSTDMTKTVLRRLKYDNNTIETVATLVLYHDTIIEPTTKAVKRWLNKLGIERFLQLLSVKRADIAAQSAVYHAERYAMLDEISAIIDEITSQNQCFSLKDLAINGHDLIKIGITEGHQIGKILNRLVEMVIEEKIENDRDELLKSAVREE